MGQETSVCGTCMESQRAAACHVCGGEATMVLAGEPQVSCCSRCGLKSLARFPDATARTACYQESYYRADGGDRFLGPFERAIALLRRLRLRSLLARAPGPAAVLDVGCGRGDLLELYRERGWRAVGTQVSLTAAAAARERRGVEVIVGELPELDLPASSFQVITFFHVLEHLDRPAEYLRKAHQLLAGDGLLVVEVPDCGGIGFRHLGRRHLCFDHPHHLFFFTSPSLRGLLERTGFRVEGISRFSLEYSPFTTLQNLLNLLPGAPNRLYRSLQSNQDGRRLRRSPWTWLHGLLAAALALPALAISLAALLFPPGNNLRFYCRKAEPIQREV
jgi:SAM-dependent methyltransferase